MTEDFKERLQRFQNEGDRLIIDEILYGITFDFMGNPTRKHTQLSHTKLQVTIDLPRHEYYISYHIRVLRDYALKKHRGDRQDVQSRDFSRILSIVRIDHGIDFGGEVIDQDDWCYYYRITPELLARLRHLQPQIESSMYGTEYDMLCYYLDKYETLVNRMTEELAEAERIVDTNILTSLERALSYADVTKSEREIVSYVNRAFSTKFGELELERNGMKRIYRKNGHGDKVPLHVSMKFPEDDYRAVLPELSSTNIDKLNEGERQFIRDIVEVIRKDRLADDFTNYNLTRRGEALINRSYVADKLEIAATTVRKRLSRIKKKVT